MAKFIYSHYHDKFILKYKKYECKWIFTINYWGLLNKKIIFNKLKFYTEIANIPDDKYEDILTALFWIVNFV